MATPTTRSARYGAREMELGGADVKRYLLWRYTVVWRKPL